MRFETMFRFLIAVETAEMNGTELRGDAAIGCVLVEWGTTPAFGDVTGFVFAREDTPDFVARNLTDHLARYAGSLKTPFFGAMADYEDGGNEFPGFEAEIQGIYRDSGADGATRLFTYVLAG